MLQLFCNIVYFYQQNVDVLFSKVTFMQICKIMGFENWLFDPFEISKKHEFLKTI